MASLTVADEKSASIPNAATDIEDAAGPAAEYKDKDIAITIVGEQGNAIDPAVEARVVRKIDLFLVPAMALGYGLVYYDKVRYV